MTTSLRSITCCHHLSLRGSRGHQTSILVGLKKLGPPVKVFLYLFVLSQTDHLEPSSNCRPPRRTGYNWADVPGACAKYDLGTLLHPFSALLKLNHTTQHLTSNIWFTNKIFLPCLTNTIKKSVLNIETHHRSTLNGHLPEPLTVLILLDFW